MYADDRERILRNVKQSVEEAGQKPEDSAYYFVIGLSLAIFVGLIVIISNIKYKTSQLEVYGQKIQTEVTSQLKAVGGNNQLDDLNNQVAALQLALSKRIDFSKFFQDLTANQYKKSKWTAINLDSDKVAITMEADNFDNLNSSLKSLENIKAVQEATLSGVSVNPDNQHVSFTVELIVDFSAYKVGQK